MEDLENVSAMDIKIAMIEMEEPRDRGIIYADDVGWVPIEEVTAVRLENRPLQPKIYPSLKN